MTRRQRTLWAIPTVLIFAALWGAKWKLDHPTPTAHDLEIRQGLGRAQIIDVYYAPPLKLVPFKYTMAPGNPAMQAAYPHFFLLNPAPLSRTQGRRSGAISVHWRSDTKTHSHRVSRVSTRIFINLDTNEGFCCDFAKPGPEFSWKLHPVTVKHVLQALRDDPKIGPELHKHLSP